MKRTSVIAAALCVATVASPGLATAAPDTASPLRTTLQRDADALVVGGSPGVLVELATADGGVKVRSGHGDLRTRTPMPWNGHFRIASFSKTFLAATMLQLVGEGRLSLADKVDRWLPGVVSGNGNDGRAITVRQLLQHTSGLHDYMAELDIFTEKGFLRHRFDRLSAADAVKLAVGKAPDFAPGTSWGYSNTNYVLAGLVTEKVTGRSWQKEVTERIIRPLGLRETSFPYTSPFLPAPSMRGYARFVVEGSNPPRLGRQVDVTLMNPAMGGGADGSLNSTTEDGNKFLRALMSGKVLEPALLAEMKKTVPAPGLGAYGLGLVRTAGSCGDYWSHHGALPGFLTGNGVTEDGRRSVMVSLNSSTPYNPGAEPPEGGPFASVIDHALCGRG
ncbi:serine hydrolase domain-containing protein [Amycolatopsis regifaucium]|uniref:D-alanyl-D-alanine carboxypeptidase n=1 Tax=Amycolatopsis regifaucium TaxID=546365 RepID=A0A154MES4_9PSEU|nr:serine hydrolase domain-containing protein [Amycolatopsis regifaucium]KZB82982.1 D-alanyl-D-alanine carboxypeptidase [Amycolatopsis regifaucium]OKA11359.1 D-alanyl-D-alanine carboxypeptidase [Amycolatopsis regifaucium]SFH43815.1 D-alanyl-D-alanine carboxypeptidase [Amycolatopsis regifaucium]